MECAAETAEKADAVVRRRKGEEKYEKDVCKNDVSGSRASKKDWKDPT